MRLLLVLKGFRNIFLYSRSSKFFSLSTFFYCSLQKVFAGDIITVSVFMRFCARWTFVTMCGTSDVVVLHWAVTTMAFSVIFTMSCRTSPCAIGPTCDEVQHIQYQCESQFGQLPSAIVVQLLWQLTSIVKPCLAADDNVGR